MKLSTLSACLFFSLSLQNIQAKPNSGPLEEAIDYATHSIVKKSFRAAFSLGIGVTGMILVYKSLRGISQEREREYPHWQQSLELGSGAILIALGYSGLR